MIINSINKGYSSIALVSEYRIWNNLVGSGAVGVATAASESDISDIIGIDIVSKGNKPISYTEASDSGGGTIVSYSADLVVNLESMVVYPSDTLQIIAADSSYDGMSEVVVAPIGDPWLVPEGTYNITSNGTYDISSYESAYVNVTSSSDITLQTKSVTPSESAQTVTADTGYDGLSSVSVSAISSTYVGSGITTRTASSLTASGSVVTAPAGYYSAAVSKAVAAGAVAVPTTTIAAAPTISVDANGLVTSSVSTSSSISPTITAGYVSTGTSGAVNVSGSSTLQLTTQAATTITPSETAQTAVTSGTYITGNIIVSAISSDYVGSNVPTHSALSSSVDANGYTVTASSGYYANDTSKTLDYVGNISASVVIESNGNLTVTPTVNAAGYCPSGTLASVTASNTITVNDSNDVTATGSTVTTPSGYYFSDVITTIDAGAATTPATTITTTPTISITSSGLVSASVSSSSSITPTVTAGYVSTGTAGMVSASGSSTFQLTTQAATTITPSESSQTAVASGVYTTGAVTVSAISSTYVGSGVTRQYLEDGRLEEYTYYWADEIYIPAGYYPNSATLYFPFSREDLSVAVDSSTGLITATSVIANVAAQDGLTVGQINDGTSTSTLQLTTQAATTITPSESAQTAVSSGVYTTGAITVAAISSTYVGSGITTRTSSDLTTSGATVTAPSGYYASAATATVASGTAGTPTATKGTVSNHSISITPSVTNTTGYITGGTKTGTAATVSASELVSGTYTFSAAGSVDVTNYAVASVAAGSVYAADVSIDGTPSISIDSSGLITSTVTASEKTDLTVTSGYIEEYEASQGTINVSGSSTLQLTLGSLGYRSGSSGIVATSGYYPEDQVYTINTYSSWATTFTPSTTDQVITGPALYNQGFTVEGDAALVSSNIISGATIFGVAGSVSFASYYTGASVPSSGFGNNGDIYLVTR